MKNVGFVFLILVLVFGCAKPNYQDRTPTTLGTPDEAPPDTPTKPDPQQPTPINPVDPVQPPATCKHIFAKTQTCLNYKWTKSATATEMGAIELFLANLERPLTPIDLNYNVAIVLWMPSMGHGSRPVVVEKQASLKYNATKIFFIMPGDWEIRFQLKSNNEIVDEYVVKIII